jgi:hypothetical protein
MTWIRDEFAFAKRLPGMPQLEISQQKAPDDAGALSPCA